MFGCVRMVDALSSRSPDKTDYGNSDMWYTLSATRDVQNSATMVVSVYHKGSNPGSVPINVIYQGGAHTGTQNSQGSGHVRFNGGGVDPSTVTLSSWTLDPSGSGYVAKITAALTNGAQSADDSNHINFYLQSTNAGDIIGPDGGGRFAVVNDNYCYNTASNCPTHTYNLPFAPDCTVPSNGSATVKVYDLDNGNPVIQPQNLTIKIQDTTTGAIVNDNAYSGGEGNGQTASFNFNYAASDKYKAIFSNVNVDNVLQITLPFDSVNAVINCLPDGNITSSATQGCTYLQGWMYDHDKPSTALSYYVDVNPSGTPPLTYASTPSGSTFAGPFTANLSTPKAPAPATGNHGFKVNIPANVTGHNYQGSWVTNTYWIYAKDTATNTYKRVDGLTVPPCTAAQCPAGTGGTLSNFSPIGAGVAFNFHVGVKTSGQVPNPGSNPPGNPNFSITVTGPGLGGGKSYTAGAKPISGSYIYSDDVSFTPPQAGTYQVSWSYYGASSNCNTSGDAGYAPYFSVLGGDIAAGPGFGTTCTAKSADITGLNAGSASYAGAGSEQGAWATGTLTNFVSGLGLAGGAGPQNGAGLSFANTSGVGGGSYGGNFTPAGMPCVTDYYAGATGGSWPGWGGANGAGAHTYSVTTTLLTLSGAANLQPDTTVDLYVKGDVYIKDDITYAAYTLGHAPRFNLFVKGNIYIDPNVGELHGLYVTQVGAAGSGNINTCAKVNGVGTITTSLPYGECKKDLTVAGSVLSEGKLILTRTFGNLVAVPGAAGAPAESFRYGPELWLAGKSNGSLDTQAYASLPPVL
jgi:hypothetical protein